VVWKNGSSDRGRVTGRLPQKREKKKRQSSQRFDEKIKREVLYRKIRSVLKTLMIIYLESVDTRRARTRELEECRALAHNDLEEREESVEGRRVHFEVL